MHRATGGYRRMIYSLARDISVGSGGRDAGRVTPFHKLSLISEQNMSAESESFLSLLDEEEEI